MRDYAGLLEEATPNKDEIWHEGAIQALTDYCHANGYDDADLQDFPLYLLYDVLKWTLEQRA